MSRPKVTEEVTPFQPVIYVFINKGLHMSVGKASAQAVHAAVAVFSDVESEGLVKWRDSPLRTVIILEARDDQHLANVAVYLKERGFASKLIIDEGVNEIDPHTITALASTILDKNDPSVKNVFQQFNLYRDLIKVTTEFER